MSSVLGDWVVPTTSIANPGRVGQHWDGRFSGPYDSRCGLPGRYVLSVTRTEEEDLADGTLPIEIVFLAEPPLTTDVSVLPPPQVKSGIAPPTPDITSAPQNVVGGGSYGAAGKLGGSGTYTDTIRPGETLFYRIKPDWGQRLGYALRFHATKDALASGVGIDSWVGNPARVEVGGAHDSGYWPHIEDGEVLKAGTQVPVAYRNRESTDDAVRSLNLAGYYYLIVAMDNDDKGANPDVNLDISVRVDGQPHGIPSQDAVAGADDPKPTAGSGEPSPRRVIAARNSHPELVKTAAIAGGGLFLLLAGLAVARPFLTGGRRTS